MPQDWLQNSLREVLWGRHSAKSPPWDAQTLERNYTSLYTSPRVYVYDGDHSEEFVWNPIGSLKCSAPPLSHLDLDGHQDTEPDLPMEMELPPPWRVWREDRRELSLATAQHEVDYIQPGDTIACEPANPANGMKVGFHFGIYLGKLEVAAFTYLGPNSRGRVLQFPLADFIMGRGLEEVAWHLDSFRSPQKIHGFWCIRYACPVRDPCEVVAQARRDVISGASHEFCPVSFNSEHYVNSLQTGTRFSCLMNRLKKYETGDVPASIAASWRQACLPPITHPLFHELMQEQQHPHSHLTLPPPERTRRFIATMPSRFRPKCPDDPSQALRAVHKLSTSRTPTLRLLYTQLKQLPHHQPKIPPPRKNNTSKLPTSRPRAASAVAWAAQGNGSPENSEDDQGEPLEEPNSWIYTGETPPGEPPSPEKSKYGGASGASPKAAAALAAFAFPKHPPPPSQSPESNKDYFSDFDMDPGLSRSNSEVSSNSAAPPSNPLSARPPAQSPKGRQLPIFDEIIEEVEKDMIDIHPPGVILMGKRKKRVGRERAMTLDVADPDRLHPGFRPRPITTATTQEFPN